MKLIRFASVFLMIVFMLNNSIPVSANAGSPHYLIDGDVEFLLPIKQGDMKLHRKSFVIELTNLPMRL